MDLILYDNGLCHERVKSIKSMQMIHCNTTYAVIISDIIFNLSSIFNLLTLTYIPFLYTLKA